MSSLKLWFNRSALLALSILNLSLWSSHDTRANTLSSETIDARKGLFRLLSADINQQTDYNFRTSLQYFQQAGLLKDVNDSTIRNTHALLGFGYALNPNISFSVDGGFNISSSKPTSAAGGSVVGSKAIDVVNAGAALTGTLDLGQYFGLPDQRFTGGLSVWVDFSRISRFFKSVNIIPTAMLTADFSDQPVLPARFHLNAGFRPANGGRYYDNSTVVNDFDRFATGTINSYAITYGTGFELPFYVITPSLEFMMEQVSDANFATSPKWITPGLKGKPFPQKNIELFAGVDIGLSSFHAAAAGTKPSVGPTPLWNVVLGFGVSQFGRRAGQVDVNQTEYETLKKTLSDREHLLSGLQRDLEYNTVQGRVIDGDTKKPLGNVILSFPESPEFLKPSTTDSSGKFVRYFKSLPGTRLVFSLDGYDSSSKFLALRPGERVVVDIALKKSSGEAKSEFVATITQAEGRGIPATVTVTNLQSNQSIQGTADSSGQLHLKIPVGSYKVEISAPGYQTLDERIDFEKDKAVLRSYVLTP